MTKLKTFRITVKTNETRRFLVSAKNKDEAVRKFETENFKEALVKFPNKLIDFNDEIDYVIENKP